MADGFFGNGVTVSYDPDGLGHDSIGRVLNIDPPARDHETVDSTIIGDTYENMLLAPTETAGELTLEVLFDADDAQMTDLETNQLGSNTAREWKITFPFTTNNVYTFNGRLKMMDIDAVQNKEVIKGSLTIVLTSAPAWS